MGFRKETKIEIIFGAGIMVTATLLGGYAHYLCGTVPMREALECIATFLASSTVLVGTGLVLANSADRVHIRIRRRLNRSNPHR